MLQSESITELAKALAKFQSEVTGAKKGGKNPHFRSYYTRLQDAWDAIREPLTSCGLSVTQWPSGAGDSAVSVTTQVTHTSGEWMRSTLTLPVEKKNAQGFGSAITYASRYALLAAVGLPPMDDDGNASVKAPPAQARGRR